VDFIPFERAVLYCCERGVLITGRVKLIVFSIRDDEDVVHNLLSKKHPRR